MSVVLLEMLGQKKVVQLVEMTVLMMADRSDQRTVVVWVEKKVDYLETAMAL